MDEETVLKHNSGMAYTLHFPSDYIGRTFAAESLIRCSSGETSYKAPLENQVTGDLKISEYVGSWRFNLLRGQFQPFVKGGYGVSFYRTPMALIEI
jgi:hypothetical protein